MTVLGENANNFLSDLSDGLLGQFGLAESTPTSLDGRVAGDFAKLGAFADKIDKSAQRSYVEDGTVRNIRPRALEIIMQQPDLTVVVKKRAFASLAENYRIDLLDEKEKLFVRATKRLFHNKIRALANYERLSKLDRIAAKNDGIISDFALPAIFTAFDGLNAAAPNLIGQKERSVLETIRRVKTLSDPSFLSSWVIDSTIPWASDTGEGTGVFELTNAQSVTAKNSVDFGGGNASLSFEDPYKLMVVNDDDIDRAIIESNNNLNRNNFFIFSEFQLEKTIDQLKTRLLATRRARGAADIRFIVSEETILYKRVRAVIQDGLIERPVLNNEVGATPNRLDPEIKFNFNAGVLGSNLFAFDSSAVEIDPAYLESNAGINGISSSNNEADLFRQIVQNIYLWIAQKISKRAGDKDFNRETNDIRRKMRLNYGGKPVIQPMDTVSIFISTKTIVDSKVTQGLKLNFAGSSILNKINDTISNIESAVDDIKGAFGDAAGGSNYFENEKNLIAGPDFPGWLWLQLRNDFTRQAAGTCVFHGLVSSASHNYSGGKYMLNISCEDHTSFFKMGRTNINPSVKVFNGALYDPLTPFDLNFDPSSGFVKGDIPPLLPENIRLLSTGSVKAKTGKYKGRNIDEKTWTLSEIELLAGVGPDSRAGSGGLFRNKFYDPDGMVYRWKEGIGTLVALGEPHSDIQLGSFQGEHSPNLTKDPFAGQDVMNVLSLLITGQPYNFNTFMRGAINSGKFNKDDLFNKSSSASFFRGLISDITKNNAIWGNFIPFKKLIINERGYNFLATGEFDLITRNARLSQLIKERAETFDALTTIVPDLADTPQFYKKNLRGLIQFPVDQRVQNDAIELGRSIRAIDEEIEKERSSFKQRMQEQTPATRSGDGVIRIFGDDISFDTSVTDANSVTEQERVRERAELRKKIGYLTQRRFWKVKANVDQNLFIVDDSYDKNYDIQAFERTLAGNIALFQSTWTNIFDQIERVAKLLGLEVFANSQGHIEVRPPQYNRMPSSVFFRLLQERAEKGIQVFPPYLESLFFNKLQDISRQIEITEDKIRARAIALGRADDKAASEILGPEFNFLTSEELGTFGTVDMREMFRQNSPDLVEENAAGPLEDLSDLLNGPLNSKINFDAVNRAATVINPTSFTGFRQFLPGGSLQEKLSVINNRLEEKTGQVQPSIRQLLSADRYIGTGVSQVAVLNVTEQISRLVAERQNLIRSMANATKNLREGLSLNTPRGSGGDILSIASGEGTFGGAAGSGQNILNPQLNQKNDKIFPEIIEHMIEDEDFDDLGVNSGQRFFLDDSKIISLTINEAPPPYTVVQVDGALANNLVPLPTGLQLGTGQGTGGNAIGTAFAVDYDMWRQYGFRGENAVQTPFFSDPRAQCAPYANFLLNLARKNIFQGTAETIGNEFTQAGEVYYVEDRDLLFYANSVTHSFTYNGEYKTSLELTYGHNPGEYIPTHLDVIGKGLYTNRHQAEQVRHVRHGRADSYNDLAILIYDPHEAPIFGDESVNTLVSGSYGEINRQNLGNILLATTGLLTPSDFGKVANIEVRVYKNSHPDISIDASDNLKRVAQSFRSWLINPTSLASDGETALPDLNAERLEVDPGRIRLAEIDLNKELENEVRSPSSEAWSQARSIVARGFGATSSGSITADEEVAANEGGEVESESLESQTDIVLAKRETAALAKSVIDIWVKFTDVEDTKEVTPENTEEKNKNQKLQQEQEKLTENLSAAFASVSDTV